MLQSIDTLIAFVVIMTVASLFVTIIVQMASAALSLRGKNLANALALIFQTLAPSLDKEAHRLAAEILSDPLLSDSTRTTKNKQTSFEAAIKNHDAPWHFLNLKCASRLASAVRPEEIYAALVQRAEIGKDASAQKIIQALSVTENDAEGIKKYLGALHALADEIKDEPLKDKLLAALKKTPASLLIQADASFEEWFMAAQSRAQQWFQLHARGLTIGASFLIAFLFQLDAVEIFHYVSVSPAARNALVAASQSVVQQADEILRQKNALAPGTDAAAIKSYLAERKEVIEQLDRQVNQSGFDLVPVGFWRWPTVLPEVQDYPPWCYYAWSYWRHSLGMLLFAALLTLGAPYWYNLLKNLTSLRPALARAIGKEETAQEKKTPNE